MSRQRRHHGSVRKLPSGRWQARYRDPLTGRRLPAPETFRTRSDASRWLASFESGGIRPDQIVARKEDQRLGDYAAEWIRSRKLKARTRELYELQLRLHIVPFLGDARVSKLEPRHIRAWHGELLRGHLSEVSVAKVYRMLRTVLSTAVEDGLLVSNPCRIKGAGIERSPERTIPTLDQVEAIADNLPQRFQAVPWVAVLAGLRKGEIFGLARRHVLLNQQVIEVKQTLQEVTGEGAVLTTPKSSASYRPVAIPSRLTVILDTHMTEFVKPSPDALVFTNDHGRPVRATVWSKAWGDARSAVGLDTVRLHDLRHLAGTMTAQTGATVRETMDRLGHSTPDAAMRYQHVVNQRRRAIADGLEQLADEQ